GIEHDAASWAALSHGDVNPFGYHVLIAAMDSGRTGTLWANRERMRAFVQSGGVFLGMRNNHVDTWLPSGLSIDRAYHLGEILAPDHPIFHQPNELTRELLAEVHMGSIYSGYWGLGEGWVPLISTGRQQQWDDGTAASDGPHYGLVELQYGDGLIVLCQMIPEYHWFHDCGGDASCEGKLMFENLVTYALSQAPDWPTDRRRLMPEEYRDDIREVLPPPTAGGSWPLDEEGWTFESEGQFSGQPDRRAVFTISHPHVPSEAGAFGRLSRTIPVDTEGDCWLRFYVSDDYCGGNDHIYEGDRRVKAIENRKRDMRYAQVLIDGEPVWEMDVLGRNPLPASRRFHLVDISDAVRGKDEVTISLQVRDRTGSGDAPFYTDVFWAGVELLGGIQRLNLRTMRSEGFETDGEGVRLADGAAEGSLRRTHTGPGGAYYVALRLRDEHLGQSHLTLSIGGREAETLVMSADDFGEYWAIQGPVALEPGDELRLAAARDGEESVALSALVLLPVELVERKPVRPPAQLAERCYQQGSPARRDSFTVRVTERAGVAREGEVATHGMPFAYGALSSVEHIRVLDAAGVEVPVQARALNHWPDGSVMFALVSFPASVEVDATAAYTVEYGTQVTPSAQPEHAVSLGEDEGQIIIDTGPLHATISTERGTLFESAELGGREMVAGDEPWAALVTTEDGTQYSSAAGEVTDVQVIEEGPLRAVIRRIGRHTAVDGSTLLEFDIVQEFYAGSPMTRLSYVFTHKEDSGEEKLRRLRLSMPTPWAGSNAAVARIWHDLPYRAEAPAAGGAAVNQHDLDAATITAADMDPIEREPCRTEGWARLHDGAGLAVTTRWWWQKWPKAVQVSSDGIMLDLVPMDSHVQFSDGPFVLHQGEAIPHEVMIAFEPEGADAESTDIFRAFRRRLLPAPDPEYAVATLALGEMTAENELLFPRYEQHLDGMYEGYMNKREARSEYGMENYGDDTFEWGYGPVYTFWSNQEYDHHHGFLIEWFRSGDRRFFEIGEEAARHYEAVDCFHWAPGREHLIGAPHHHNTKHIVEEGWYPDHALRGASNGHSWVEGLLTYWLLTGDVRAEETARQMGDWYIWTVENNHYGAGGQERGPGWTLVALSALYRLTGDERFRAAGDEILDWMERAQDAVRGVVSVPISEQPSYEGGTSFMHGILGRGLGRFYEATGEERAMRMGLGVGEWLSTEPMGPPAKFWYKQSPRCKRGGYGATSQCINALSYPYRYTGDEWFGWLSEELWSMTGPSSRSCAWMYSTLAHLAPRRTPLDLNLGGREPVVAPGHPFEAPISLRNTTEEAVEARLSVQAPEGLTARCQPSTITVPPAAEAQVKLQVTAAEGAEPAAHDARIVIGTQAGMQRQPMTMHVLSAMVEVEAGVEDATLTDPFTISREGDEAWIGVPRDVRFNPDPWAPDDDAGSITWTLSVPEPGEYTILGHCWWLDAKGNSFYVSIDGREPVEFGNDEEMERWKWVTGPRLRLEAGQHTVTFLSREDGARISRVTLSNAIIEH
ncbi:MAG: hypothetical protein U9R79_10690, partial [Armatimonadota bacterium]|nr:hypothetical protein [Armatimonadota bacterium]